ncbi:MAG: hypothetical protein NPIRA01_33290 [Nitrospirales bacterium]|nr:MAG: hypothetical protein NPIRA01_33290 [Nitrospirales bacterium]
MGNDSVSFNDDLFNLKYSQHAEFELGGHFTCYFFLKTNVVSFAFIDMKDCSSTYWPGPQPHFNSMMYELVAPYNNAEQERIFTQRLSKD